MHREGLRRARRGLSRLHMKNMLYSMLPKKIKLAKIHASKAMRELYELTTRVDYTDPLPAGPPPAGTAQAVDNGTAQMFEALLSTPGVTLTPNRLRQLGGQMGGFEMPELVARTIMGLRDDPDAFPDAPTNEAGLREWQSTANAWQNRARVLRVLLRYAEHSHVFYQAGAAVVVRRLIDQVYLVKQRPEMFPHLDVERRFHAMLPALGWDWDTRLQAAAHARRRVKLDPSLEPTPDEGEAQDSAQGEAQASVKGQTQALARALAGVLARALAKGKGTGKGKESVDRALEKARIDWLFSARAAASLIED